MASEEEKADAAAAARIEAKYSGNFIHWAANDGNLKALRHFLRVAPEKVHEKHPLDGQTPLHVAAEFGKVEVAELLLSKGAAVDAKTNNGNMPLHVAAIKDKVEVAELLLSKGAAVDAKDIRGKTPLDVAREGRKTKMEQFLRNRPADKTSQAGKKDAAPHAAGSGVVAVKHQRETSKQEAKKLLAEDGKAPVHRADKASQEVKKGTTIVPNTSAVEIPTGEGTPVAMFSARFDGGPIEQKMRRVHKILVDNSYSALMVQVDAGESFGVLTARYLGQLKADKGLMIAVCTHHYGEMTSSEFCSYYELKFAVTHGITVLPLRVEDTYPPQPACGKDHLDKHRDAQGFIDMKIGPDVLYVDCRTMSEMDIACAIATRLRKLRDERQVG